MSDNRSPRRHSLRRNVVTLLSGSLTAQLATVAALPILSRLFDPVSFGEYTIFLSVTALLAVLATLRYEMAIVLPRSNREAAAIKRLGNMIMALACGVITVVALTFTLAGPSMSTGWKLLVILLGPGTLLLGLNSMLSYWLMRINRYAALSASRITQSFTTATAQILIGLAADNSAIGLIAGFLVGQLAAFILMSLADTSRAYKRDQRSSRQWTYLLRKHWRFPAMTTPQSIVDAIQMNGINLAIGYVSFSALGQYSQAWRLVSFPVGLIGSTLGQVYYPELANTPRRDLFQVARKAVARALAIGFFPFLLMFFLSPTVIPWLLGEQWVLAGLYAQALTPWLYLVLAASPMSTVFVVLNKQKVGLIFSIFYAVIPIVILVLLRDDLYVAIVALSLAKTVMLVINLGIILWYARFAATNTGAG